MADIMSRARRSALMALIRGTGNRSTEMVLAFALRSAEIRGWRRHWAIPGRPDFAFPAQRVALFVDGCFWHGCPRHYQAPASNARFWAKKISGNRRRDRSIDRRLRKQGWRVIRVWEHCLRRDTLPATLVRIARIVGSGDSPSPG